MVGGDPHQDPQRSTVRELSADCRWALTHYNAGFVHRTEGRRPGAHADGGQHTCQHTQQHEGNLHLGTWEPERLRPGLTWLQATGEARTSPPILTSHDLTHTQSATPPHDLTAHAHTVASQAPTHTRRSPVIADLTPLFDPHQLLRSSNGQRQFNSLDGLCRRRSTTI
jgi:hypothetical protein